MGGGGGGYFPARVNPEELASKTRDAEQKHEDQQYAASVNGYLNEKLAVFNDRDSEGVQAVLSKVCDDLSDDIGESINTLYGGSVAKHTYVDGISDVDALVALVSEGAENWSPSDLKDRLASLLRERYGNESVGVGDLAVTLRLEGQEIQLLPARRVGGDLEISSSDGSKWSRINPEGFANKLTQVNKDVGGKVVPTIKIVKGIVALLPDARRLTGYHIESLAIQAFQGYRGERTTKEMVKHFFESSATAVRSPIADSSGQSVHVDDYLGDSGSAERRMRSDALARLSRRLKNADGARSLDQWRRVLGDE